MVSMRRYSEIAEGVFLLHDPMFPVYLIHGPKPILVDCAILAKAMEIDKFLHDLLQGDPLVSVILTHSHYDHTGSCSFLQEKHKFNIVASQRTKEILQNPKAIEFIDRLNRDFNSRLLIKMDARVSMPENIVSVHEGDVIKISDKQWLQVYETPGHSRCSVAFLLKPENILFPGDATGIIERDKTIKPLFLSSYLQYVESINKIKTLDVEILALPHNQPIKGRKNIQEFLDRTLLQTELLKDKILSELRSNNDFNAIAEKLSAKDYSRPTVDGPREALLINLSAMVKSVFNEIFVPLNQN
jgi:glyoxylase-like metal-dependent hydrolase (beta-lactamase superfamily II)